MPFWLLFSMWYYPEYLRRISAQELRDAILLQRQQTMSALGQPLAANLKVPLNRLYKLK
jgi:hypothetical protein